MKTYNLHLLWLHSVLILSFLTLASCRPEVEATLQRTTPPSTATSIPLTTPLAITPFGEHSYYDRPDDYLGQYQLHVLYVVTEDFTFTTRDLDGSIDEQVRLVNEWFINQTGEQSLRFDTYNGKLDITFVVLPLTESELFSYTAKNYEELDPTYHGLIYLHYALEYWIEEANKTISFLAPGKLYVTFFDSSLAYVCGDGPVTGSRIIGLYPNAYNLRDQNECKAFLGEKRENERGVWEQLLAHEIIHALGFPTLCAKNLDIDKVHIKDPLTENDIMDTALGIYDKNPVLDPNHDDYYLTNTPNCPDLSNSPFLSPLPNEPYLPPNVLSKNEWRLD